MDEKRRVRKLKRYLDNAATEVVGAIRDMTDAQLVTAWEMLAGYTETNSYWAAYRLRTGFMALIEQERTDRQHIAEVRGRDVAKEERK